MEAFSAGGGWSFLIYSTVQKRPQKGECERMRTLVWSPEIHHFEHRSEWRMSSQKEGSESTTQRGQFLNPLSAWKLWV